MTTVTQLTQLATVPSQVSYPTHTNSTSGWTTVSTGTASTSVFVNSNYYNSVYNAKFFKLGHRKICIWNYDNKYFMVDNVNFSFETTGTTVHLNITTLGQTKLKTLDEVRNYIKTMKLYYLKAKEFEKQLNLNGDFA